MRFFAVVCFAWCCLLQPGSFASTSAPPNLQVAGKKYVKLQKWAESRKLRLERQDDAVSLISDSARVDLKVHSAHADVNRISVFFGFPVQVRDNEVWMAQQDVDGSLAAILFPQKNKPGEQARIIAISAGHGGKDTGNRLGEHLEKQYTLLLAKELQRRCARAGLKTVLIRGSDQYLTLAERTQLAKKNEAGVFIELHYNCAGPGNTVSKGAEAYCLTLDGAASTNGGNDRFPGPLPGNQNDDKNILLAYQIQRALVTHAGMADRGVRRARFEVLRDAEMPAVLVEAGFMSEPSEMRRILSAAHRRRTAQAILDGLLDYKRAVER